MYTVYKTRLEIDLFHLGQQNDLALRLSPFKIAMCFSRLTQWKGLINANLELACRDPFEEIINSAQQLCAVGGVVLQKWTCQKE